MWRGASAFARAISYSPGASAAGSANHASNIDAFVASTSTALSPRAQGAWSQFANLLVVDNPVGVGFSFVAANASSDAYCATQECVGADFVAFLGGFYARHPELDEHASPLILSGESYAGKYLPSIATALVRRGVAARFRPGEGETKA